jgi:hypothetical protein
MPLSTRRVREIFSELGRAARVPDCHPHKCRHTAATEFLAERPGAEIQLRSRLGQVSGQVLADYVTISDPTATEAAGVASLSAKWGLGSQAYDIPRLRPKQRVGRTPSSNGTAPVPAVEASAMDMLTNLAAMLEANPGLRTLLRNLIGDAPR